MATEAPDDLADRLYGLELDEFTPARDAAAKELRKEKRRDEAAVVAKLRKPSAAAWLVNRLARERPEDVDALLEAGEALRDAQERAVAGEGAGGDLREAADAERRAVDELVRAARELEPGGRKPSQAALEQVRATLHAAAADPTVREGVRAGRLVREVAAGGAWPFADPADEPVLPAEPRPERRKAPARGDRKPDADERKKAREEEARQRDEEKAAAEERRQAEQARRKELHGRAPGERRPPPCPRAGRAPRARRRGPRRRGRRGGARGRSRARGGARGRGGRRPPPGRARGLTRAATGGGEPAAAHRRLVGLRGHAPSATRPRGLRTARRPRR